MRRKKGFWTDKRKQKLWELMTASPRKKTDRAVARYFKKPLAEIYIVFSAVRKERLFTPVVKYENGIKVTVYAPGYADGIFIQRTANPSRNEY